MSEISEKARKGAKEKAQRLSGADPARRVDASGYRPEGAMDANVQTGMRPLSRRQYRQGGAVAGESVRRADRKPRASGGRSLTADSLINRDVREANKQREGTKHDGGFKRGGRALPSWAHRVARASGGRTGKLIGGALTPQQRMGIAPRVATPAPAAAALAARRGMLRKDGGKVHADEAQDRKLIHEMGCKCSKCSGGRIGRKSGGKLTAGARKHIAPKNFAGPDRSYPIEDESHARNALARVAQHGSPELQAKVRAKVHAKYPDIGKASGGAINDGTRPTGGRLARKGGGRAKKGVNVNVIITQPPTGVAAAPTRPVPAAPPGVPGMHQGTPPVVPVPASAPAMAAGRPAGLPPGVMRASGGRAYPIDTGAGGGLGRLQKIRAYG